MNGMEAIRATFFLECEEQLAELETGLMALQHGGGAGRTGAETIDAVFRAVHSIKGGAGAFSLDGLVRFAHVFETALDDLRSNRLGAAPEVIRVLLRAADVLADLVRATRDDLPGATAATAASAAELAALRAGLGATGNPGDAAGTERGAAAAGSTNDAPVDDGMDGLDFQPIAAAPVPEGERSWSLLLRPRRELYERGNDAANLLRELSGLGALSVRLDVTALPDLAELDPEDALLCWSMVLRTARDEAAIRDVFEFVDDDCELVIEPLVQRVDPAESMAGEDVIAALLRAALAPELPPPSFASTVSTAPPPEPDSGSVADGCTAEDGPRPAPSARTNAGTSTIRVGLDRVDRLINLVGELVINEAMVSQRIAEAGLSRDAGIAVALEELGLLTREIQDSVMAIRAQPVRSVFARMPRLLREVCAMTGKPARLLMEGENTEVDKTVIEHLSEPLTHMIRNAVDHGLEDAAGRAAANKPAEGLIRLSAAHRSGRIVIELSDDGGGIDRGRVRNKAVDRGLVAADATLTDEEVDNLIFLPGFSTADRVSDLSGRGVGMDVVRRSVQALGGRISISSRPARGSTFVLSLPLTLAVLDGMVIDVGGQTLIVPLAAIVETLRPKPEDVHGLGGGSRVASMRGHFVPMIDLGTVLGFRDREIPPECGVALLVEDENGDRKLLVADAIRGQRQVVIKSLEVNYRAVPGISAATVMGDGRVALILDVDAVAAGRMPPPAALPHHATNPILVGS